MTEVFGIAVLNKNVAGGFWGYEEAAPFISSLVEFNSWSANDSRILISSVFRTYYAYAVFIEVVKVVWWSLQSFFSP